MNVYKCRFQGYWPVGAAAVVVASDLLSAKSMLETQLTTMGLKQDIPVDSIHQVELSGPSVHILCDGDY